MKVMFYKMVNNTFLFRFEYFLNMYCICIKEIFGNSSKLLNTKIFKILDWVDCKTLTFLKLYS